MSIFLVKQKHDALQPCVNNKENTKIGGGRKWWNRLVGLPFTLLLVTLLVVSMFLHVNSFQRAARMRDVEMATNLANGVILLMQGGSSPYVMNMAYNYQWEPIPYEVDEEGSVTFTQEPYVVLTVGRSHDEGENHWDVQVRYANSDLTYGETLFYTTCYAIWNEQTNSGGEEAYAV